LKQRIQQTNVQLNQQRSNYRKLKASLEKCEEDKVRLQSMLMEDNQEGFDNIFSATVSSLVQENEKLRSENQELKKQLGELKTN
jgi:regulator of replication initiation timing